MFRTIRRWVSSQFAPAAAAKPRRTRLAAEPLEAREVPTVSQVVHLTMWHDFDGDRFRDQNELSTGTGTMIGRDAVLTCGHNLYNIDLSRGPRMHATEVIVTPGRNNSYMPFGQTRALTWVVAANWTRGDANSDIGVIRTTHPIGDRTGWFGYAAASDAALWNVGSGYRIVGYPGTPLGNGFTQAVVGGSLSGVNATGMWYRQDINNLRTAPGNSGSGLLASWLNVNGRWHQNVIVGVHTQGQAYSWGSSVRLTSGWVNFINSAVQTMPRSGLYQSSPLRLQSAPLAPRLAPVGSRFLAPGGSGLWQSAAARPAVPARAVTERVALTAGGIYAVQHLPAETIAPKKAAAAWADDDFAGLYVG